jgi:hypothetical protein
MEVIFMKLKITYSATLTTVEGTQDVLFFTDPALSVKQKFEIEEAIRGISGVEYVYATATDDHKNLVLAVTYNGSLSVEELVDRITAKLEEYFSSPGYTYEFNADHIELITEESQNVEPWLFQKVVKPGEKVELRIELTSEGINKKDTVIKQIKEAIEKDRNNTVVEYRDIYYKNGCVVIVMIAKKEFRIPEGKVSPETLNKLLQLGDINIGAPQLVWWIVLISIATVISALSIAYLVKTVSFNAEAVNTFLGNVVLIASVFSILIILFILLKFLK